MNTYEDLSASPLFQTRTLGLVAIIAFIAGASTLTCQSLCARAKDGMLDLGFMPLGASDLRTVAVAGGDYYFATDRIQRLHRDGALDESFQCPIRVTPSRYESIERIWPLADRGFFVAGTFHVDSTVYNVAKVRPDGSIDEGYFNNQFGPLFPAAIVTNCIVDSRERVYITGPFQEVNGDDHEMIVRLLSDGTVDPDFAPPADVRVSLRGIALTADDKLLLVAGYDADTVVRLNDDGSIDSTFAFPIGFTAVGPIRVAADGRIAAGARRPLGGGFEEVGVYVFKPDGTQDISFSLDFNFQSGVYDIGWEGDRILASGLWTERGGLGSRDFSGVVRFNADGSRDATWTQSAICDQAAVKNILRDDHGSWIVWGSFDTFAGVPRAGLARLNPGSDVELKWFNTSARGRVTPSDPLIVGFVVGGNAPQRVLVRGVGESLTQLGVSDPLPKPVLSLHRGDDTLLERSGWWNVPGVREAAREVGAFALLPTPTNDAADTIILSPGVYTLVVASGDGGSGTTLAEVYTMDVK